MASIVKRKNGLCELQFNIGRRRCVVRLGKVTIKQSTTARQHVEALIGASITGGGIPEDTHRWLCKLDDEIHDRISRYGLVQPRARAKLGKFIEDYIEKRRPLWKPSTVTRAQQNQRHALAFFKEGKLLRSITVADVHDYRAWLLGERGLKENTARKALADLRSWMKHAHDAGLIDSNPVSGIPVTVRGNPDRQRFITDSDARKVLAELPTQDLRVLFVLSRWAGLRIPSEVRGLTWADIDWAGQRMTVRSPKTARHAGHEQRTLPLFPEVERELREAFTLAAEGDLYVCPLVRRVSGAALRKPILRAITAAGLEPWPRLFHAMRGSRATEIAQHFPGHVASAWLGHSQQIAREHYLLTTDDDYKRALTMSAEAQQNAQQHPPARDCTEARNENENCVEVHENAPEDDKLARVGLEPTLEGF